RVGLEPGDRRRPGAMWSGGGPVRVVTVDVRVVTAQGVSRTKSVLTSGPARELPLSLGRQPVPAHPGGDQSVEETPHVEPGHAVDGAGRTALLKMARVVAHDARPLRLSHLGLGQVVRL